MYCDLSLSKVDDTYTRIKSIDAVFVLVLLTLNILNKIFRLIYCFLFITLNMYFPTVKFHLINN